MTVEFRPEDVEARRVYRTLTATVVPRPIGWISTRSADGTDNLAPYSFFNVACVDPPLIHFSQGTHADGALKDTANNIHETEEFVHNVVTEATLRQMHQSSTTLPPTESEFDAYDIDRAPSRTVSPARVADSPIAFECTLDRAMELGTHTLFIGEVQYIHFDESVTINEDLDIEKLDTIGRLTAGNYLSIDSKIKQETVKDEDFPKTDTKT